MSMTISGDTIEDFINILPAVLYEYVLYKDRSSEFLYMSPSSQSILENPPEYFLEDTGNFWSMVHPADVSKLYNDDVSANKENDLFVSEIRLILPSGKTIWIQMSSKPTSRKKNDCVVWSGYIIDVTARKNIEEERDNLVLSLKDALNEVKTIQGVIPICSYCHSIRNDNGAWDQLEAYILENSKAIFSHGICPDCLGKAE